jgi:DNA-binding MarR family transcriptional regulator
MPDQPAHVDLATIEALRQHHIGRLLWNAHRSFSERALAKLRQRGHAGLSLAHTNLLAYLDVQGTRITTLAERIGVTKQAIGSLVGELEAKGYIHRDVDPTDRRAARITYTAAGRAFLQDAYDVKREIEAEYAAALGEHGLLELRQLLTQLVAAR